MKKRLAWAAVVAIIAIPAAIYENAVRRAAASLRRHAEEIDRLDASFRARGRSRPCAFDDSVDEDGGLFLLRASKACEILPVVKWDALTPAEDKAYQEVLGLVRESLRRRPASPVAASTITGDLLVYAEHLHARGRSAEAFDALLLSLGLARDVAWADGDFCFLRLREIEAMEAAEKLLDGHTLTAADLEAILARWDRLERSRPALGDDIDVQDSGLRSFALKAATTGDAGVLGRPGPPTWRTGWSWTITRAAYLADLEEHHERLRDIARRPWPERVPAAKAYLRSTLGRFDDTSNNAGAAIFHETEAAAQRQLIHAALLVARYEAEHGRRPDAVPGNPLAPDTGKPYEVYEDVVRSENDTGVRSIRVRRR